MCFSILHMYRKSKSRSRDEFGNDPPGTRRESELDKERRDANQSNKVHKVQRHNKHTKRTACRNGATISHTSGEDDQQTQKVRKTMTIIISGNRAVCNHRLVRESLAVFGRAPKAEKAIIVDSRLENGLLKRKRRNP